MNLSDFKNRLKIYMKDLINYLKEKNPARVDSFKAEAQAFFKGVVEHFDDYEFYVVCAETDDLPSLIPLIGSKLRGEWHADHGQMVRRPEAVCTRFLELSHQSLHLWFA